MRTRLISRTTQLRPAAAVLLTAGALCLPALAHAQTDVNPPMPNAMLLVDTSGSMEYMMGVDEKTKKPRLPVCNVDNPAAMNEQNRWITLQTVLAGEFPTYSCWQQSRSEADFLTEYTINGVQPYDRDYYLPYTRAASWDNGVGCVMGPDHSNWPGSGGVFSFSPSAIRAHRAKLLTSTCAPAYGTGGSILQTPDGLLDAYSDKVRFGLMTFDNLTSPKTGLESAKTVDYAGGMQGMWSYYPGWDTGGGGWAKGRPEQCDVDQDTEVGARNPSAPPWEGRAIAFGPYGAPSADVAAQNERIQQALMAMRPYGATPLAGMLADAQYFFSSDPSMDYLAPSDTSRRFGPKDDPYINGGCRKNFIILLTDGAPNLDLRPGCKNNPPGGADGTCPYKRPAQIAYELAHPSDPNLAVRTFVVGFAFSEQDSGGPLPIDCTALVDGAGHVNSGICGNPANDGIRACCEMAEIAYNGGTEFPRFADNKVTLRKALNEILSEVASQTTSRTMPVFAAATSTGGSGTGGYDFFTSFRVSTASLWAGVLERQRLVCNQDENGAFAVEEKAVSVSDGDDFAANMISGGPDRYFYTVEPPLKNGEVDVSQSIRTTTIDDGLGKTLGSTKNAPLNSFYQMPSTDALKLAAPGVPQSVCGNIKTPVSVTDCRNRIMRWELGLPPIDGSTYTREKNPLGSIYHSSPVVIGPPRDYVNDEAYTVYANQNKTRPMVLYTATTDGQLHAFQVAPGSAEDPLQVKSKSNNELWSFFPPGVLSGLKSLYPGVEQRVLDLPVVVRDVIPVKSRGQALSPYAANAPQYRSILASGFGSWLGGYYAIDVTKPVRDPSDANTGPKFLWQVSKDDAGRPLFGTSVTPTITTLFFKAQGEDEAKEIAVALLPGGDGPTLNPGSECTRASFDASLVDNTYKARSKVRCYGPDDPSRSLTIVRLDTGEVVRRLARYEGNPPMSSGLNARTTLVSFDSPITSSPIVYPNGTGQIATRAFIGDRDGTMWRIDLSDVDPSKWSASLFFDAYTKDSSQAGQPITQPPSAAVDGVGNVVLVFSTGDQEQFEVVPNMQNYVWSVSESPDLASGKIISKANWRLGAGESQTLPVNGVETLWNDGQRVTGPISIFNGVVYFATFRPAPLTSSNVCTGGGGVVWAVDYLQNRGTPALGPQGRVAEGSPMLITDKMAYPPAGTGFASVSIGRQPTCFDTTTYGDPFLTYGGSTTSVSNVASGDVRLLIQTGNQGKAVPGGQTNALKITLPKPPSGARLTSWAAVVE